MKNDVVHCCRIGETPVIVCVIQRGDFYAVGFASGSMARFNEERASARAQSKALEALGRAWRPSRGGA